MSDSEEPGAGRETVVTVSREIEAPAEEVWAMVSDISRMGEWSPEATGGKWLKGADGPAVGARFRGRNQRGWRRWSTTAEVVECEPGRSFAFDIHVGPFTVARWSYRFEPTAQGCRVTEVWEDKRQAFMHALGRVATGVSDRATHNRQGMEQTLERVAAAVEGASAT
ncbi:MAG TPA: SRPBCC family protein [Acidimicrobiales bacterium]|nr:SRPBCC family protein [Acidimicrobiales bacterium]